MSVCRSQFGYLSQLQEELTAEHPALNINLLAINKIGAESGVAQASTHSNCPLSAAGDPICPLPIVNDTETDLIWDNWGGDWRDVFILDTTNATIEVYNLTQHNLSDPVHYAELQNRLTLPPLSQC